MGMTGEEITNFPVWEVIASARQVMRVAWALGCRSKPGRRVCMKVFSEKFWGELAAGCFLKLSTLVLYFLKAPSLPTTTPESPLPHPAAVFGLGSSKESARKKTTGQDWKTPMSHSDKQWLSNGCSPLRTAMVARQAAAVCCSHSSC